MISQKKYLVEGNINFFDELKKSIGGATSAKLKEQEQEQEQPQPQSQTQCDMCLITNNALIEHSVTLPCKHTFNYIPLYNEIQIQKCVKNLAETAKLQLNEIKCPYCRKIHNMVLPYYEDLCDQCPLLNGVNMLDMNNNRNARCNYVRYTYTDGAQIVCGVGGDGLHYCEEENQYYCYNHWYVVSKRKQKELKHQEQLAKMKKIKEEQQLQKNALKEAKAAAKLALKVKPVPTLSKTIIDTIDETNEVVNVNNLNPDVNGCTQILKTGLFKGDLCNKQIYKNNMCKRHFNLSNAKLLDEPAAEGGDTSLHP